MEVKEVKSTTKYVRISSKKARDVAREIQGLPVSSALDILKYTPRKAARLIGKTLKTAIADAENNFELNADTLVVKEAVIGIGPALRRFKPRARGSAGGIRKPTSHIRIVLAAGKEDAGGKKKKNKAAKGEKAPAAKTTKASKPAKAKQTEAAPAEATND
jgi:large subunit ribosomal protein L22